MPTCRKCLSFAAFFCLLFSLTTAAEGIGIDRRASFALGDDSCDDTSAELAAQPDGTFLAVWQRCEPSSIAAQRFDAIGRPLGGEIDLGSGLFPQVAALPERGFAVAYLRQLVPDFEVYGVFVRRLDPNGAQQGDPRRVDEEGADSRVYPAVPRLAAAPDGRLFVAWRDLFISPFPIPIVQLPTFGRMLAADLAPLGPTADLGMAGLIDDLDVSFDEAGRALAVTAFGGIAARRYDDSGVPLGAPVDVGGGGIETFNPRLAPRPGGGWWLVWEEGGGPQASTRAFLRALGADGQPAGPRTDAGLLGSIETTWPSIGVDPDGRVLVTGRDRHGSLQARLFDGNGAATSDLAPLAAPDPFPLGRAALAESAPTGFLALWQAGLDRASPPPPGVLAGWDLRGASLAAGCPSPDAVCARVGDSLAEVAVQWRLASHNGTGRGLRIGSHLLFALENPGRFDVAVDLRGGAIDWAATTNAEVTLRWTEGGFTRTATKPRGPFAAGRLEIPAPSTISPSLAHDEPAADLAAAVGPEGCTASARTACLFGGRFRIAAFSTGADGVERPAGVLAYGDRQTLLTFSEAGGAALSLIDGRAQNGKVWVYWGGLSKAAFRIEVTDLSTGTTRTYSNPAGKRQSRADRMAF